MVDRSDFTLHAPAERAFHDLVGRGKDQGGRQWWMQMHEFESGLTKVGRGDPIRPDDLNLPPQIPARTPCCCCKVSLPGLKTAIGLLTACNREGRCPCSADNASRCELRG